MQAIPSAIALTCALLISTAASAAPCTEFERTVFDLAEEADGFQKLQSFRDYGWSRAGPTNGWLDRWRAVRDQNNDLHLEFMRQYGFIPGDLYTLADAYRTGNYDSFYAGVEREIQSAERCH